jgi:hypothetical protein
MERRRLSSTAVIADAGLSDLQSDDQQPRLNFINFADDLGDHVHDIYGTLQPTASSQR